jgi:hypothetical protein
MKMSELKAKIRTEILAELSLNEDDDIDFGIGGEETQADVDFYEGLEEATKDGDGKVPSKDTDTDINIEDKEEVEVDVEEKPKASGADGEFLDQLEDLQDEAGELGDDKLERQINNTITYFTRQHIAKDTNESLELEEDFGPAVQSTDPKAREIEKKIQDNPELQKQIAQIMAQAQKGGDTSKLLGMMTGLFEADELDEKGIPMAGATSPIIASKGMPTFTTGINPGGGIKPITPFLDPDVQKPAGKKKMKHMADYRDFIKAKK